MKKSFILRIEPELFLALEQWAADNFRSVNGQIEYLLTDAIRRHRKKRVVSKSE